MAERLALAVIPGVGWSAEEIQAIAREAEAAGFDAIFAAEVNNDVMATAQLMGAATSRIQVGTWIANIYLRHSYTCAQGARSSVTPPAAASSSGSASATSRSIRRWGSPCRSHW
jgi:hypothetical protein